MAELVLSRQNEISACIHCGNKIPRSRKGTLTCAVFCCGGCEAVYSLLHEIGLERFHSLKPSRLLPLINYFSRQGQFEWLDALSGSCSGALVLQVEGIQCAACVWAIRELARKMGSANVQIDVERGELDIAFTPGIFPIREYLETLQRLGYRTAPPERASGIQAIGAASDRGLLVRLGICMAIAMNTMALSAAFYVGLGPQDGALFSLFTALNFYLTLVSVSVGGSYFFNRAVQALRYRVLHFDIPVAIGLFAAFVGSAYNYSRGHNEATYFDTVSIFIALMLLGRYLQSRFLARNRSALLGEIELNSLRVTRLGKTIEDIAFSAVEEGDRLLIQSGGILPVSAILKSDGAVDCSLAWISGESLPLRYTPGDALPAGALVVSRSAIEVESQSAFLQSQLSTLVPPCKENDQLPMVWQWVSKWYVALVLAAALMGLIVWIAINPAKALPVFTSILVVTCPCSLGISIPLARRMANKALLACGVFARNGSLLDQWMAIRAVCFDKTGTLTLAALAVNNPQTIEALSQADKTVLFNAVSRSRHPASQAVYEHLKPHALSTLSLKVEEVPGQGLDMKWGGCHYHLGRPVDTDAAPHSEYPLFFYKDGKLIAHIRLVETLLDDARETVETLRRENLALYLLSGDRADRVQSMAATLGIDADKSVGDCRPDDKARFVHAIGEAGFSRDAILMLGDGLNDGLAFAASGLCGAPVWEKSVLAERADFFFISGSLRFLPAMFRIAKRLHSVIRMNLLFALFYNLATVAIAMAGQMTPLAAAILMPTGSLAIVGVTTLRMRKGDFV